jgi:TAG lipase / lysophosphatidylethanolamine acyltransferase
MDPSSKLYDWRLVNNRLQALQNAREDQELATLVNVLRSGMVRNLGNITSPRLFSNAYAGTKNLIEQYVFELATSVEELETWPVSPGSTIDINNQAKMNVFHDARQAFGRSALVLQGGAMFGLCHLGVVKALHLKGLLPRIIAGTATGALIAALVAVHRDEDLTEVLTADGINLKAFDRGSPSFKPASFMGRLNTLLRRLQRLVREGHFLDMDILRQCLIDNVGDMTFDEAHNKTNRILNITVAAAEGEGMPSLLNHITAPHVVSTQICHRV